jgi:hypothetical protein
LEPITKHLFAKDINKFHLSMDECKITKHYVCQWMNKKDASKLGSSMDELA